LAGGNATTATIYSNRLYDYAVRVPNQYRVEYDQPPSPDHGFSLLLGGDRRVTVFADYDTFEDGSAIRALQRSLGYEHWTASALLRKTRLSGLPAASAEVDLGNRRVIRLLAFRANNGHTATLYHFYLETDAANLVRDRRVFDSVLRGFILQP
jgi:hypothetical protein